MLALKIRSLLELQELLDQNHYPEITEKIKLNPSQAIRELTKEPDEEELDVYDDISSLQQLSEKIGRDHRLIDILKSDPVNFIQRLATKTPLPEYNIYKILVSCLCAIVLIIITGVLIAWLTKNSREAPTLITAVACTTLGLLAGIFVSVPGKRMTAGGSQGKS
jgi:hypothetical protein